jgi:hypothetical protein
MSRSLRAASTFAASVWGFALVGYVSAAATEDDAARPIRVRIEWSAAQSQVWAGVLETSQGTIVQPASLNGDADEVGALWADGKSLWLQRHRTTSKDGFDATLIADSSARLSYTLQTAGPQSWRHHIECALSDLGAEPKVFLVKNHTATLTIRRAPGDLLRVSIDRPHLLYSCGERFHARLIPDRLSQAKPSDNATIEWRLCAARTSAPLQNGLLVHKRASGSTRNDGIPVEIPLPGNEGAFDLHFRLMGTGKETSYESVVQVLVLANQTPAQTSRDVTNEVLIDHFHANECGLLQRVESAVADRADKSPSAQEQQPARYLETEPSVADHWANGLAVRLNIRHPERPHRLTLQLTGTPRQFLGVSLMEPSASAQAPPLILDTGIATTGPPDRPSLADDATETIHRDIIFWPRVADPTLLLHDVETGRPLQVADVAVRELTQLPPAPRAAGKALRLAGPYLSEPLLAENFGAPEAAEPGAPHSRQDWQTFHLAALRLAERLRFAGDNSVLLAVMSGGGTIYPSNFLEPTPRYDNGTLGASGQDPVRKDVLELLYRVFDREGLILIPELQFSSPLPALERQLAGKATEAEGIELIGHDGRSGREARGAGGAFVTYYNALDPRVQDAVADVVQELLDRYRRHGAFRGVALDVCENGCLQLPGLDWGYDDATMARFQQVTGMRIDDGGGPDRYRRRYEILSGEGRSQWIRWRCQELNRFHRRLANLVASAGTNSGLVLSCRHVLPTSDNEEVRRGIRTRSRLSDLLLERGLDFAPLSDVPGLTLLRPAVWRASTNTENGLLDEAVNQNPTLAAAFGVRHSGLLMADEPRDCRVPDFDRISGGQAANSRHRVTIVPDGWENRRRVAAGLLSNDAQMIFAGGAMIPMCAEQESEPIRRVFRALPAIPFYRFEAPDQPAIVRVARHEGKTYLYALNGFSDSLQVSLQLSCPGGTVCRPLGPSRSVTIEADSDTTGRLNIPLDGYELAAWEIQHEDAHIRSLRAEVPPSAWALLQPRIQEFDRRLAEVRRLSPVNPREQVAHLGPASEKRAASGEFSVKEFPISGAAFWPPDPRNVGAMQNALQFAVGEKESGADSRTAASEGSRPVVMSLRLRGDRETMSVRLKFEATIAGNLKTRQTEVTVGTEWRRFEFRIEDLPPECQPTARLHIESLGPGHIWAEHPTFGSESLSSDDLSQLAKTSLALSLAWDEKRFADCRRLLDSYWVGYLLLTADRRGDGLSRTADAKPALVR